MARKKIIKAAVKGAAAVVKNVKQAAQGAVTVGKGLNQIGGVVGNVVKGAANAVSKHPKVATRVAGAATAVSGVKDIKAYKTTRDKGTLARGLLKTIGGGLLTIFNDPQWYTKLGPVTPAINVNRPMNPALLADFSVDATKFGVTKHIDIDVEWDSLYNSLVMDTISVQYMNSIRETLKSNLPYSVTFIKDYIHDSIGLTIAIAQIVRQMTYFRWTEDQDPLFYQLINKRPESTGSYGPVNLYNLDLYSEDNIADTISYYDVLRVQLDGMIYLPGNLVDFINYYYCNLFLTDSDMYNSQYVKLHQNTIYLKLNHDEVTPYDISSLDPKQVLTLVKDYYKRYSIVRADFAKAIKDGDFGTFQSFVIPAYADLQPKPVYSEDFLQAILNAYTDSDSVENGFIRLDFLNEKTDLLTTLLMQGAIAGTLNDSPLYVPTITVKSMCIKVNSNPDLEWDRDLFQSEFGTVRDFGLNITSHIYKDTYFSYGNEELENIVSGNSLSLDSLGLLTTVNWSSGSLGNVVYKASTLSQFEEDTIYYIIPVGIIGENGSATHLQAILITMQSGVYDSDMQWVKIDVATQEKKLIDIELTSNNNSFLTDLFGTDGYVGKVRAVIGTSIEGLTYNEIEVTNLDFINFSGSDYISSYNNQNNGTFSSNATLATSNANEIIYTDDYIKPVAGTTLTWEYGPSALSSVIRLQSKVEETIDSAAFITGFVNLDSYIADQMDYHLPMLVTNRISVQSGSNTQVSIRGESLIKENYIPLMYNVKDLPSVLYTMFYSLMM